MAYKPEYPVLNDSGEGSLVEFTKRQEDKIESAFNEIWTRTYLMDDWMVTEMSGGYVELSTFQVRWTNSSGVATISLPFEMSTAHAQVTLQHRTSRSLFHVITIDGRQIRIFVNNASGSAFADKEQGFWVHVKGKKK